MVTESLGTVERQGANLLDFCVAAAEIKAGHVGSQNPCPRNSRFCASVVAIKSPRELISGQKTSESPVVLLR